MTVDWKNLFKHIFRNLVMTAIWIVLLRLFVSTAENVPDNGAWKPMLLSIGTFVIFAAMSVAMVYFGVQSVIEIQDEFVLDDFSDGFGLIGSTVLFLSSLLAFLLYCEMFHPQVIDTINSAVLLPLTGEIAIPVFPIHPVVFWVVFGLLGAIMVGLVVYELIHTKLYFIPTMLSMLFCGFCLTLYIACILLAVVLVIYFGLMLLAAIAVVFIGAMVLGGLAQSEPSTTRYFVKNKQTGEGKEVYRTGYSDKGIEYTDTSGNQYYKKDD